MESETPKNCACRGKSRFWGSGRRESDSLMKRTQGRPLLGQRPALRTLHQAVRFPLQILIERVGAPDDQAAPAKRQQQNRKPQAGHPALGRPGHKQSRQDRHEHHRGDPRLGQFQIS